ncbi:MAG TPA: hypothetical protein VMZ25_04540, partial [Terriglobales bacterium]|nr:hypothetical protein [Terriglobales bacterium]
MRLHNRPRTLSSFVLALACLLAASAVVRATFEDKQLSVYAPQGTYSVRVIDDENRESADLMAVLAPISKVVLRIDGNTARFPGGIAEAHFNHGENSAQVGQKRVRFPGKISIVEGRVFVPVVALPALLQEMVGMRGELHEAGRRLFVENTFSHFTVELKKGESPEMLLSFPQRVNPNITQEGNKLRLVFRQEPVTMTGSGITFDDPRLTGLHFEEKNGTAEITISGA